jgi:3-hydroxybutyryl-CoA dehydrogenase
VVIGGGTMGIGIAYVAATSGFATDLVEVDPQRCDAALDLLTARWEDAVRRGKLTADEAAAARTRVNAVTSLDAAGDEPDVLVEAVPEIVALKRDVLAAAELKRPGLLATNTSSIPIRELAGTLSAPDRFVGLHFFNPVWAMALVEIVVGPATAPETAEAAVALAGRLGKEPIVVRDAPGFATSRLGIVLGLEAIRMVEEEVASAADIDKGMVLGYRHPMGPLELTDHVGLDVRLDIARGLHAAYGDRFAPPALLERMVADGKLGRKSGQGFYTWIDGKRVGEQRLDGQRAEEQRGIGQRADGMRQ